MAEIERHPLDGEEVRMVLYRAPFVETTDTEMLETIFRDRVASRAANLIHSITFQYNADEDTLDATIITYDNNQIEPSAN